MISANFSLRKSLADKLFSTFDTDTKLHLGDIAELYQPKTIPLSNLSSKGYPVYGANGIIGSYNKFNHMTTNFGALPPKISIVNPVSISEHNHPKRV